ncbi:hypothetical protein [Rhodococcus sp. ARC_M6]|uniref:TPR repeat region-containing protein n=1 Tax=Rhodococcus sp. ARC_M6 TaxID=2928852 RepID=UPI001FB3A4A1|nr:hypothetical protein [Rhodococcus sp. ARC_M6]
MTVSQAKVWRPEELATAGAQWQANAESLELELSSARRAGDSSQHYWEFSAGDAMRSQVTSIATDAYSAVDSLTLGATALNSGAQIIRSWLDAFLGRANAAEGQLFSIADDGVVSPPPPNPLGGATPADLLMQMAALKRQANLLTVMIQADLRNLTNADSTTTDAISRAFEGIVGKFGIDQQRVDNTASLANSDGTSDGTAFRNGNVPPEMFNRVGAILTTTALTPEQLAAIERGEPVSDLPQVNYDYLRNFYNAAGKDGLIELSQTLREQELAGDADAGRRLDALANGILTVSNENIGTGTETGGFDKLPPDLQDLITHGGGSAPELSTSEFIDRNEYMKDLAFLLGESNPGYQPGTELGVELDKAASRIVEADTGIGAQSIVGQKLLEVGTRNETSTWELVTSPDRDRTLIPLLEYGWGDDGKALGGMFDWIPGEAISAGPEDISAQRAGETARGLADLLSSTNSDSLLSSIDSGNTNAVSRLFGIAGAGGESLGDVNPLLTQSIAGAMAPYVNNMAGMSESSLPTSGFGQMGPVESTRVFALLDTDPAAGTILNGEALRQASAYQNQIALDPESDLSPRRMEGVGRLRSLVEGGINMEVAGRELSAADAEQSRVNMRTAAFGMGQAGIAGACSFLPPPFGPALSTGVYMTGSAIVTDFVGPGGKLRRQISTTRRPHWPTRPPRLRRHSLPHPTRHAVGLLPDARDHA